MRKESTFNYGQFGIDQSRFFLKLSKVAPFFMPRSFCIKSQTTTGPRLGYPIFVCGQQRDLMQKIPTKNVALYYCAMMLPEFKLFLESAFCQKRISTLIQGLSSILKCLRSILKPNYLFEGSSHFCLTFSIEKLFNKRIEILIQKF